MRSAHIAHLVPVRWQIQSAAIPPRSNAVAPVDRHATVVAKSATQMIPPLPGHQRLSCPVRQSHHPTKLTAFIHSPSSSPEPKNTRGR